MAKLPRMIALFALLVAGNALAQTLEVELRGVQHERGSLRVGLYVDPKTFRKEVQAFQVKQVSARPGTVKVEFSDLKPGTYAIMAYHDEDGNGELNRRLGMFPTEGYGLSKNPEIIGPPTFEESEFRVGSEAVTRIGIDMRY